MRANNKIIFYGIILIFNLLISLFSSAQKQPNDSLKNKIGVGGWWYNNSKSIVLNCSYSLILHKENELCLSTYYFTSNGSNTKEIIIGTAYYYSIFKKKSRFDLFIAGELFFNWHWHPEYYSSFNIYSRYGALIGLGIIPSFNISNNLSLAIESKFAYGYNWSKEYHYVFNNYIFYGSESGNVELLYYGIKLNYKF